MNDADKIIEETIKNVVEAMGFSCKIETQKKLNQDAEILVFNIVTDDPSFLIGQHGANLQSLQHLLRILIKNKIEQKADFIIDVNSYRDEKNSSLARLAKSLADEAVRENRDIVMRPMSSYERRIVHMELAKNSEVITESIGEGENRKVVIKPAGLK